MKQILTLIAALSISAYASAECSTTTSDDIAMAVEEVSTDTPAFLKGATVTVTLASGKTFTMKAEEYKVVPRQQQFLVTQTLRKEVTSCQADAQKNRASLVAGYGPTGNLNVDLSGSPNIVEVESKRGLVGGAQYQRLLDSGYSVGVQGQSNGTGSLLLGLEF